LSKANSPKPCTSAKSTREKANCTKISRRAWAGKADGNAEKFHGAPLRPASPEAAFGELEAELGHPWPSEVARGLLYAGIYFGLTGTDQVGSSGFKFFWVL
jgi:hypothetical protein